VNLVIIPSRLVDHAWRDGAHLLSESCVEECTPDQLKMLLSREERYLVRMDDDGKAVGWSAFRIKPLPNMRVFFVTNLWARGAHFERFYDELKGMAEQLGCSRIRFSCLPAQSRIFKRKLGAIHVYDTLEVRL